MSRNAQALGYVDYVLSPKAIADALSKLGAIFQ